MNFYTDGSDPYETPRSMPYDSYDLNSHQHETGEESDEINRVDSEMGP